MPPNLRVVPGVGDNVVTGGGGGVVALITLAVDRRVLLVDALLDLRADGTV